MRIKGVIFLVIFFLSLPQVEGKTTTYLSFEYLRGQVECEEAMPTFKNVQLGIIFSEEIQKYFDYKAEVRVQELRFDIEQAWIRFKPSVYFSISAGLYLVPFGRYNQRSRPYQTMLVRLPLHVEEMYPSRWRDIGVLLEGKLGPVFWTTYLGNGLAERDNLKNSQQFEDNNEDKAEGGRVSLNLSKQLEVSISYNRGKYDESGQRNLTFRGADVAWKSGSFQVLYEYAKAVLENPEPYSSGEIEGHFVQVSFAISNLWPVVSYQHFKYEDPFHGEGFTGPLLPGTGILDERSRWAVGLVYSPSENLLFKIEYDFNHEKTQELKNNTFSFQAALSF